MRLKVVADSFLALMLLALGINLALLLVVRQAGDTTAQAVARRDAAHAQVDQLVHETDLLSHLVQSYTTTGRVGYLEIYYDILAVRQGDKPAPVTNDPAAYWREVVAGRRSAALPAQGDRRTLIDRLRTQEFSLVELDAARAALAATEPMQAIEKTAFAATQGLYDRRTQRFVSDGEPDMALAIELVHAPAYEAHRAGLLDAVQRLASTVEARTSQEVDAARERLQQAIVATLAVNALLLPLFLKAAQVIHRRVLQPIHRLEAMAARFASGNFSRRTEARGPGEQRQVEELQTLAETLDSMAAAIENDLRQRDQAQQELQDARDQAQAAAQAKGMFLANMSHEIRTPMNAIMGMTQLALRTELTNQQRDYLKKALGASDHLLALINDVLDFSKIEAGGMALEDAPFELEAVLSQAINLVRQRAQDKELELLCDVIDPSLLANNGRLRGDAMRLAQVLTNLLGNAVKFTPAGQVVLSVDTEALPADAGADAGADGRLGLVIAVRDTGIGMTAEQCDSLFREFAQADVSTTRRFGGTGLGLAISKRLVELMGGRIVVTSSPGRGSQFTLHLPLHTQPAPTVAAAPLGAAALRVLVVDDQRDTLVTVQALLQRLGVGSQGRIAAARSGADALDMLIAARENGLPFDLMLLDWVLPDLDGAEAMRRAQALQPGLRVAVMTAYGSPQVHATARALGGIDLLDKPVLPDDLRRLFRAAPAEAPAPEAAIRLDGLRVLLVEDNALNRELALELLIGRGAQVRTADHGLEALARLHADGADAYDVVLMDLQMPVMDGYEAVRQLREQPAFDTLPILAMTANAMAGERERCLAAGMQGHIAKPLDSAALFRQLNAYCHAPAAARTVAAPAAAGLPEVAGLDTTLLLAHCDGNLPLARRLLSGFAQDHADGVAGWADWITAPDWPMLTRAAHTLRGLAGTLGAAALQAEAERLEALAKAEDAGAAPAQLARVDHQLAELLNALEPLHSQLATPPLQASAAGLRERRAAPASSTALPDLAHLARLLQDSDSQAMGWWQSHEATLQAHLPPAALRRIGAAMARFDFDAALQALERLQTGEVSRPADLQPDDASSTKTPA
ncbi:MAG: response regulator [Aquabacterium sp.]|nr:response regulator [Aquabacterium sp.]